MSAALQPRLFDYAAMDTETRIVVQQRTGEIKSLMKRAAQDIIDIGEKLTEVKERIGHGHFGDWLGAEFGWDERTARNLMQVAETFRSANFSDLRIAPSALYTLAAPSTPQAARDEALDRAHAGESITYSKARAIVQEHKGTALAPRHDQSLYAAPYIPAEMAGDGQRLSTPPAATYVLSEPDSEVTPIAPESNKAALFTSEAQTWKTPPHIVAAAVAMLGVIDLDPCCNTEGPPNIPAHRYYREADNGLALPWSGGLYVNPPYDATAAWVEKLVNEYQGGAVAEAVLLVASRTDTRWFQLLNPYLACFIRGRLRFSDSDNSAPFPSVVFYLGRRKARFVECFSPYGQVWTAHP